MPADRVLQHIKIKLNLLHLITYVLRQIDSSNILSRLVIVVIIDDNVVLQGMLNHLWLRDNNFGDVDQMFSIVIIGICPLLYVKLLKMDFRAMVDN